MHYGQSPGQQLSGIGEKYNNNILMHTINFYHIF